MASYDSALPPGQETEINDKLAQLAGTNSRLQGMVASTQAEHRVARDLWAEFFALVVATDHADLAIKIRDWARSRTKRGPTSQWFRPLVQATTRGQFVRALLEQVTSNGLSLLSADVELLVDDLISPAAWTYARQRADDLGLNIGVYTIWSTFSSDPRPYAGLPKTVTGIARELGWDDSATRGIHYKGDRPLLVFEFQPADDRILFPTMIEAWASDPLNYYFLPAPAGAHWGRTRPWPSSPPETVPRPEVVHSPYSLGGLVSRVLEVST